MLLRIKFKYPVLSWHFNGFGVFLDFIPICLVPHVARRFAGLLDGADAVIPSWNVSL